MNKTEREMLFLFPSCSSPDREYSFNREHLARDVFHQVVFPRVRPHQTAIETKAVAVMGVVVAVHIKADPLLLRHVLKIGLLGHLEG